MLEIYTKKLTKKLKFNLSPGKFKGKKFVLPAHKTDHGIVCMAFKIKFKDIVKILLHRKVFVQQITDGEKAQALTLDLSPIDFEKSVQENEDWYDEQDLLNSNTGSES